MGKIVKRFEFRGDRAAAEAEALLDSGAGVSIIRRDVVERLSEHFMDRPAMTLRMVNGEEWLTATRVVALLVEMKGKLLDGSFYIVDTMPREVIVGVDFMQKWEIKLDPKNHDFTIGLDPGNIEMAGVGGGGP